MKLLRTIFLLLISISLFANSEYIDSIDLAKVKKLVQKEEEIALAYKNYVHFTFLIFFKMVYMSEELFLNCWRD